LTTYPFQRTQSCPQFSNCFPLTGMSVSGINYWSFWDVDGCFLFLCSARHISMWRFLQQETHVHMDADTLCFIQASVICTAWSVNQNIHVW